MEDERSKLLFIGAGRMAQAMISGLVKEEAFAVTVANNRDKDKLKRVGSLFSVKTTMDWKKDIQNQDVIVLAMPPEVHEEILSELSHHISERQLVITVAAGINTVYMEEKLGKEVPVTLVMPNTAADLGKSITLYAPGRYTSQQDLELVRKLLKGIGAYQQVTEKQLHLLTAITGSAPAFLYEVASILERLALETGITEEQARNLVSNMFEGSAAMLKTGTAPAALAAQVATPGGSTAAGLQVLKENDAENLFRKTIEACREKANISSD